MLKPLKRKYEKPRLRTAKSKVVGGSGTIKHWFRFSPKRVYSREYVTQKHLDILKEALATGLSVERPFDFESKGPNMVMAFVDAGKPINSFLFRFYSRKKQAYILNQVLDILAGLHNLGILHSHPHRFNIMMDNKAKITLIDFEHAKKNIVDWPKPEVVFNTFYADYSHLRSFLLDLGLTGLQRRQFFEALISKYKYLSEDGRKYLFKNIPETFV